MARFRIKPEYRGLRVCTADFVIDLNENTKQKDLEYLFRRGYEGVVKLEKKDEGAEAEGGK